MKYELLFCDQEESIHHLLLDCPFEKKRLLCMHFNLLQPINITNLFQNWLNRVAKKIGTDLGRSVCFTLGYMKCLQYFCL
jgi:hypothetical protein